MRSCVMLCLSALSLAPLSAGLSQAASIVLTFDNLNPTNQDVLFVIGPYQSQGFSLSSTLGFNTYGTGESGFYAGSPSLSPIAGSAVVLTQSDGSPFSLSSIALARNFDFDPPPTVTFTGKLAGGGTVTQAFTVTTPTGTAAFQTFHFTDFNDVIAVDWSQGASAAAGLHQFTDVTLSTGFTPPPTVPEPASFVLLAGGIAAIALRKQCGRSKLAFLIRRQRTRSSKSA